MMIRAISHLEVQYWEPPLFATLMILFIELELISEEKKKGVFKISGIPSPCLRNFFPKSSAEEALLGETGSWA